MAFHCVAPGPESDALKEAMFVRPLDELAGQIATTVTAFKVPTACAPGPNPEREDSRRPHHGHGKKNNEEREPAQHYRHGKKVDEDRDFGRRYGNEEDRRESWLNE
jgi:hypothetical protein